MITRKNIDAILIRARHRNWKLENSMKGTLFSFIRYLFVSKETKNIQLIEAAKDGNLKAVQFLLSVGADVDTIEHCDHLWLDTTTPLLLAAYYGYLEIVKLLLEKGANVNVNWDGPLIFAMKNGHKEIAMLLFERGFYAHGGWVFLAATESGASEIVKMLIDKGVDVNVNDTYGNTPLSIAKGKGHKDIVQLLTKKPAQKNNFNLRQIIWL